MDKKGPMEDAVLRLSGNMATPHVSEAEREVVLKANAMLTLADDIDVRAGRQGPYPAVHLTRSEWDLICYALRHTADSDN